MCLIICKVQLDSIGKPFVAKSQSNFVSSWYCAYSKNIHLDCFIICMWINELLHLVLQDSLVPSVVKYRNGYLLIHHSAEIHCAMTPFIES